MSKNKYRAIILSLTSAMIMAGCSEWTRPEKMELESPSLEKDNPELWQAYLASLREYKATDHKVMIVKFDNHRENPIGQAQRISALPDSIDYIMLENIFEVSETHVNEMTEAREKGTKFLFTVDFDNIKAGYEAYLNDWKENHPESLLDEDANEETPGEKPIEIGEYIRIETEKSLSEASKYYFEGIVVSYEGISPTSMPPAKKELWKSYQDAFFGPIMSFLSSHNGMELIFRGVPINIIDNNELIAKFKYAIIECYDVKNADALTFECRLAVSQDIPECKIIPDVMIPSVTDQTDERGTFLTLDKDGKKIAAAIGAAEWTLIKDTYIQKAGICISRTSEDYYKTGSSSCYSRLRKAISIMNYSPEL